MSFRRTSGAKSSRGSPGNPKDQGASRRVDLSAKTLRQLDHLQLTASRFLRGQGVGKRASLRRKPQADFREHRKYVPGDDVRFIDWKASARQDQVFVKQGEEPKECTVYLLLDCSASMGWGEIPKSTTQLRLAAALGYLTLAHGDRLIVRQLGGEKKRLGPIQGKGQMASYLQFLRALQYGGRANVSEEMAEFGKASSVGGLTFILSDFLGEQDLDSGLTWFPVPTWEVVLLHLLHPEEIDPGMRGDLRLVDIETGATANYDINSEALEQYKQRLESWRISLDLACVENNAFYSFIPTNWSIDREVLPHLRSVQILMPQ